jgi:hypothetical protein
MKTPFALAAFVLLASAVPALADACVTIGDLAQSIMEARQANAPLSSQMAVARKTDDEWLVNLQATMIFAAYDLPRLEVPENQAKQTLDFRNAWELRCYRGELNPTQ